MKKIKILLVLVVLLSVVNVASADTFGTGTNQFTIDFVNISGDASSANGTYVGDYKPEGFIEPGYDYRMGKFEITNDQWSKFKSSYGTVTGSPSIAYDEGAYFTGTNVPNNELSWYEAAQFVNYLNTSTGHQAAYKFTGTQGTGNYTMSAWDVIDTGYNASNPFRNSNAHYFMPTEDEWVKAAYWNGTGLQTYATKPGDTLYQGNGSNGGWNYYDNGYATNPAGPWDVGSGSEELNGTYDMMGNVFEWTESISNISYPSNRNVRGGGYIWDDHYLGLSGGGWQQPELEHECFGFRVASVPEPSSILLLFVGALALRKRKA